jgi:hypothetical protein
MITQLNQRVLFNDNGTVEDITLALNNYRKGIFTLNYTAGQDFLIVGVDLPFNNRYFDLNLPNAVSANVSVDIWDGSQWREAVDILDATKTAGASLGQSDIISFTPKKYRCDWICEDCSDDVEGLAGTEIYNKYWMRFYWDASFTASINHIGQRFNNDDDLFGFYPDLFNAQMFDCFAPDEPSGTKTDWIEQSIQAVEAITRELRARNIVISPNQILDPEIMRNAAIHKTAEIVYSAFGTAYEENRLLAQKKYKEAFNVDKFNIDLNATGELDCGEAVKSTQYLRR